MPPVTVEQKTDSQRASIPMAAKLCSEDWRPPSEAVERPAVQPIRSSRTERSGVEGPLAGVRSPGPCPEARGACPLPAPTQPHGWAHLRLFETSAFQELNPGSSDGVATGPSAECIYTGAVTCFRTSLTVLQISHFDPGVRWCLAQRPRAPPAGRSPSRPSAPIPVSIPGQWPGARYRPVWLRRRLLAGLRSHRSASPAPGRPDRAPGSTASSISMSPSTARRFGEPRRQSLGRPVGAHRTPGGAQSAPVTGGGPS